jgi:hypothetical protein
MKTFGSAFLLSLLIPLAAAADVTKEDIRRLHAAGVAEDVIVSYIHANRPVARLSVEDLADLKREGVGDKVLAALVAEPSSAPRTTTVYASPSYTYYPSYPYSYGYTYAYPYRYSYPYYGYYPYYGHGYYGHGHYPYYSYRYPYYSHHGHRYYHSPGHYGHHGYRSHSGATHGYKSHGSHGHYGGKR